MTFVSNFLKNQTHNTICGTGHWQQDVYNLMPPTQKVTFVWDLKFCSITLATKGKITSYYKNF